MAKKTKPKFKVGDYVVFMHENMPIYMIIYNMSHQQNTWMYNILVTGNYYPEAVLREPTDAERKSYFVNLSIWK